jgi:hypothetical protein
MIKVLFICHGNKWYNSGSMVQKFTSSGGNAMKRIPLTAVSLLAVLAILAAAVFFYVRSDLDPAISAALEPILSDSTFFVKATLEQETPYLEGTSYRYTFRSEQDFSNNLRLEQDGTFSVYSFTSGLYEPGQTYCLFLTGEESYMADTIMYIPVDENFVAQYMDKSLFDQVDILSSNLTSWEISAFALEREIKSYVKSAAKSIQSKTVDTFSSDAYPTLESTVAAADAIWLVTIRSCQSLNPNASICSYRIDQVLRENLETTSEGDTFHGVFPTAQVTPGSQYYLVLADTGNYEYQPFTFDHWLIPSESVESSELLDLLAAD